MAWVRPTGHSDPDNVWDSETLAYDGWTNTGTVSESVAPGSWTGFLILTRPAIQCDKIRFNVTSAYYEYPAEVEICVYYNGAYHSIYKGVFPSNTWVEKSLGAVYSVTRASLTFHISSSEEVNRYAKVWEFNFNQLTAPTVTTQAASDILLTSVQGNGNITNTGGINCTTRGFCYMVGTTGNPTTANSKAYDTGSFGTGAFSKLISGLSPGTNYRVRAYAINSVGTGYGATVQILTHFLTIGSGQLTYSGTAVQFYTENYLAVASGQLTYSGSAVQAYTRNYLFECSGSFVYSGEAIFSYLYNFTFIGSGGLVYSGIAEQSYTSKFVYIGNGIFTYLGSAINYFFTIVYHVVSKPISMWYEVK